MPSVSSQLDRKLAADALRKIQAGQRPTAQERSALKRLERDKEEELRWQYYRTVPQKHVRAMTGLQTKQLHEQAQRYGIPFGGSTVDLTEVFPALFRFLAANARILAAKGIDDPMLAGPSSPALERYRAARAAQEEIRLEEMREVLVRREAVHLLLLRGAQIVRSALEQLQREWPPAAQIMDDALVHAMRVVDSLDVHPHPSDSLSDPGPD